MGRKKKKRKGRRSQAEDLQRIKKKTLFRGGDNSSLPTFDPHRPVPLPNLVRSLANIPLEKTTKKKKRKKKQDVILSNRLAASGLKHFKGSFLAKNAAYLDKFDTTAGKGRENSPPATPRVRGRMLKMKRPDLAPPIPARGIMKLRCSKNQTLQLKSLGCSYVPNEMLAEDEKAKEWLKKNRNCDLFMKKVDPTIDENAYSINEEAQLADSSSHMFGVHFRGALFIPNGSTWDGNKLLQVRAEARRRMKKYEKKKKKARREQRRRDRNEKFLLSGGVL